MHTTTTYARRHRHKYSREDDPRRGTDEATVDPSELGLKGQSSSNHLKRKRPVQLEKEAGIEPLKKKKSSKTVDKKTKKMSLYPFQTPFPTIQAHSQVFRLPSSSPKHSPGLLSPVPVVLHKPISASKNLKENSFPRKPTGNSKSGFHAQSSALDKTLSSTTLRTSHFSPQNASGPGLSSRYDRSRSTSRSSSTSSAISSTLKDTQGSNTYLKHSKSLTSLKGNKQSSKRKQKQKQGKLGHSASAKSLSDKFPALASPFSSPSCSPAKAYVDDYQKAHIPGHNIHNPSNQPIDIGPPLIVRGIGKQTIRNATACPGLSEIFFNPNLPDTTKPYSFSRGNLQNHTLHSAQNSPQKEEKTEPKNEPLAPVLGNVPQSRKHKSVYDKQKHMLDRNRRPSAPSSLQPPRARRHINLASLPRRHVNNENPPPSASVQNGRIRLGSGLSIALGPSSPLPGPKGSDAPETNGLKPLSKFSSHKRDSDAAMEWMHARGTIDFNRPPSQMSSRGRFGFEYPEVEAPDVFFSSSSSSDEDEHKQLDVDVSEGNHGSEQNHTRGRAPIAVGKEMFRSKSAFGFNDPPAMLNFGEEIWGASSPFKNGVRHLGLDVGQKTRGKIAIRLDLDNDLHGTDLDAINVKKERQKDEKKQASTLTRSASLPNFKANEDSSTTLSSSSLNLGSAEAFNLRRRTEVACREEKNTGDGEMDMELTGSRVVRGILVASEDERNDEAKTESERDWTPWITDSIISPPTGYLGRVINKGDARVGDKHLAGGRDGAVREGSSSSGFSDPHYQRLCSPFELLGDDTLVEKVDNNATQRQEQSALRPVVHARNPAMNEPVTETKALIEDTDLPANTTRTRSGTIVPIRAPIPPGIRRTRGGTIVGPLPAAAPTVALPSIPMGFSGYEADLNARIGPELVRRSRSGTVTGPISAAIPKDGRIDVGNTGQLSPAKSFESFVDTPEDHSEEDIECYIDSMYLPPLASSPDPIDFLRFASIMEEDEEYHKSTEFQQLCDKGEEIVWQVAEDPPSPEIVKKRGNKIFRGMGLGGKGWPFSSRADRKRKSQKKARFVGDGLGADGEDDEEIGQNGDTELSDDELLLRDSRLS